MKGPSEKGDSFAVLEYMKGGQVVTHPCAPLQKMEFFIRSPSLSSSDESSDSNDDPIEVIWAKAARGVWGMAHVFDGKLYFTRDHMQGNFIPKNLKLQEPKPAPKPRAKASSKATSSGDHVQLFRMVYDRKKGFQAVHL